MKGGNAALAGEPVPSLEQFNRHSGNLIERGIFNHRLLVMLLSLLMTVAMAWYASQLKVGVTFNSMLPQSHAYIRNYLDNQQSLGGLGNAVRVVVENKGGDIYDADYLTALQKINDDIYVMEGVDRPYMKSLWMPVVRWTEVTDEGFVGGPVMPETYDASPESIAELRGNILRGGLVGSLVANDARSSMIFIPLMELDAASGRAIDSVAFSRQLDAIRQYESDSVGIRIIGFPTLVGDLVAGLQQVMLYFLAAVVIAMLIIYLYTRCVRSTVLVSICSVVAVVWQLGLFHLLGYSLDPYSILVPFLVFAIGVSHGAQKMNGIMQDIGRGTHRYVAARYTFRRLFLAGLTALLADAVGFAVLMMIDIPVIRALALSASIGVGVLIFTNLILLPVLLSFTSVSPEAARRSLRSETQGRESALARLLVRFTQRGPATVALLAAVVVTVGGVYVARDLQIGDLDAGAPELRPNSRYNRDTAYISEHYDVSSDQFAVIVKTPAGGVASYQTLLEMDRLEDALRDVEGVRGTVSVGSLNRFYTFGASEGNPKWLTITRDSFVVADSLLKTAESNPELVNNDQSIAPVVAYLTDHKAATLERVMKTVEAFAQTRNSDQYQFLPAAGSSGIDAVTNRVVAWANYRMLALVYLAVAVLCLITFRSWRAVVVALVPLLVTSVLCEALMVWLGIGVKVATLPVVALGVGIGVDYALYLLSVQLDYQRSGMSLAQAYAKALDFTGKVVALIGVTLAVAVVTWVFSPIKFQADMGILLTFMFLWNMLGALVLIPALSHFLLRDAPATAAASSPVAAPSAVVEG